MPVDTEQAEQLAAYERVFTSPDGEKILANLVIFAQQTQDAAVRVGRQDVVLHCLRSAQRGKALGNPRTVSSRAGGQEDE